MQQCQCQWNVDYIISMLKIIFSSDWTINYILTKSFTESALLCDLLWCDNSQLIVFSPSSHGTITLIARNVTNILFVSTGNSSHLSISKYTRRFLLGLLVSWWSSWIILSLSGLWCTIACLASELLSDKARFPDCWTADCTILYFRSLHCWTQCCRGSWSVLISSIFLNN